MTGHLPIRAKAASQTKVSESVTRCLAYHPHPVGQPRRCAGDFSGNKRPEKFLTKVGILRRSHLVSRKERIDHNDVPEFVTIDPTTNDFVYVIILKRITDYDELIGGVKALSKLIE